MPEQPPELSTLLSATDATARDQAWEALVQRYTPVILAAIHVSGHDRDASWLD